MRHLHVFVTSAVVLGVCSGVVAGPVTINMTGTSFTALGGISIGDAASFSITYETSASPIGGVGSFSEFEAATLNDFTVGTFSYTSTTGFQEVATAIVDYYASNHNNVSGALQDGLSPAFMTMALYGSLGSVLSTHTSLPSATQMGQFTDSLLYIYFGEPTSLTEVGFTVTSVEIIDGSPIPLPGSATMAFVGMGVVGVRRRRN